MDLIRLVFDRLNAETSPDARRRGEIYDGCRAEVAAGIGDPDQRRKALADLEKVIRRQEMQAIHEELGLER